MTPRRAEILILSGVSSSGEVLVKMSIGSTTYWLPDRLIEMASIGGLEWGGSRVTT